MSQTVVTNGDGADPGRAIQSSAVYKFNLNSAKSNLNNVLQLLKDLDNKPEEQVTWYDVQRLEVINHNLVEALNHYRR